VNVYDSPLVRPTTVIGLFLPVACAPPADAVTVHLVIGEPFDDGAWKRTVAWPLPAVAVTFVGTPGTPTLAPCR
jgi:hypothetical protein